MDRIIEKKRWTIKKMFSYTAAGIFALFIIYLFFFRDNSSKLYVEDDYITIAEVKKGDFQEFIPIDGVVFPKNTIYIDAINGGNVERIQVEDGAILNKGDTILKLVNAALELSFMEQETRTFDAINNNQNSQISLEKSRFQYQLKIAEIQSEIDRTTRNFERQKELFNKGVIPKVEFEDSERDFVLNLKKLKINLRLQELDSISGARRSKQLKQSMVRMENNLNMMKKSLDNLYIKAPAQGKLSSFSVEIGETKSAGEHLGQIDLMDGFKIRANIDERYIARVSLGQEAEFTFDDVKYDLEIKKIYTDVQEGKFQVDMKFPDTYPKNIKRGQTLQLRLKFSSPQKAVMVKRGGFFQDTGGHWIYVMDASGDFAEKRNIRIHRQNTDFYEVVEGLNPGEKVIVSSYSNYGEKDKLIFR
ncbi:MAG: efflux RND transporter periplasmic adaptor subunit [Bacteroidales bacterium]